MILILRFVLKLNVIICTFLKKKKLQLKKNQFQIFFNNTKSYKNVKKSQQKVKNLT